MERLLADLATASVSLSGKVIGKKWLSSLNRKAFLPKMSIKPTEEENLS
ncbi:MAG: hypothetical protein JNK38_08695 [Acidobacteria bacterium]|nr:hypothetical protein [Acidobacteriota bacterium]